MTRMLVMAMLTTVILSGCNDPSVTFRPVYRSGDRLVASDEPMDPRMRGNVIHVLRFYQVDFRAEANGTILIPRSLANDLDTLWNYTTKAQDEAWLREHPVGGVP